MMISCVWLLAGMGTLVARGSAWDFAAPAELELVIAAKSTAAVAFVLPGEDKSKALDTQWHEAASTSPTPFLAIDCTAEVATCEIHVSSTLPSVQIYKAGNAIAIYKGPRRSYAIAAWIARSLRPPIFDIVDDSLDALQSVDETLFIANFDEADAEARSAFQAVASNYDQEFTFGIRGASGGHTHDPQDPVVKCYRPLEGETRTFQGPFDRNSLESFVKEASRPIIGELLPHNHQRFLDRGWPMVYVFAQTEAERAELRDSLQRIARSYYDSLTMVTVDPLDFPELPAKLGIEVGSFPAGAVHQLSNDKIYPYTKGQAITPSALQQWGLDVWQGRVQPWTPPGATPAPKPETPGRIKASRKVSIRSFPGMKINIGRDEL